MTNEEAIRILDGMESTTGNANVTKIPLQMAIRALKKQIPMKPIRQSTWKACPVCKQGIGVTSKTPNPKAVEYCFHCGKRLDWNF